jgi:hypothetical protein
MKKLLFQLDTDEHASVFDTVVGYDGGADHVIGHGNCTPDNVTPLVEGAIFTRSPKEKKNTALFIGGSDMAAGEALLDAVQKVFFADFRVSLMLDSNGSNTTAAAAVARILSCCGSLKGKKAVILAGTGPVGRRAAVMMTREGASVTITSRKLDRAEEAARQIRERFGEDVAAAGGATDEERAEVCRDANIVFATGAAGRQLLAEKDWQAISSLEVVVDANATPPLGIEGIDMMDKGKERHGKAAWGAIGFGTLKLALHRACIGKLFDSNDQVFDVDEIFALAKTM